MWHPRSPCTKGLLCSETNDFVSEPASYFFHLKCPQRSWRITKDKPVLELLREISLCPEDQQLPPRQCWLLLTATEQPGGMGTGQHSSCLAAQGTATKQVQLRAPLQPPAPHSSTPTWAGWNLRTSSFCSHFEPFPHAEKRKRKLGQIWLGHYFAKGKATPATWGLKSCSRILQE